MVEGGGLTIGQPREVEMGGDEVAILGVVVRLWRLRLGGSQKLIIGGTEDGLLLYFLATQIETGPLNGYMPRI